MTVSVTFTLEDDLKAIIARNFAANGIAVSPSKESLESLLRKHINFQNRLIEAHPRNVHRSRELRARTVPPDVEAAVNEIQRKTRIGVNLNVYLSTLVINPDYHDALFYDWGIQHLHLGLSSGRPARDPRFVNRASELLFVFLNRTDAYFIDVLNHDPTDGFANRVLLEIVHSNWRHLIKQYQLNGALGVSRTFTNDETRQLRAAGVNVIQQVANGTIYSPLGGGITTARTGMNVTIEVDKKLNQIRNVREELKTHTEDIKRQLEIAISQPVHQLIFGLELRAGKLTVIEKNSGAAVREL